MKKILIAIFVLGIMAGCNDDEFDQPTVTLFPNVAQSVNEGAGTQVTVAIQVSRVVDQNSSVTFDIVNGDFLEINGMPTSESFTLEVEAGESTAEFTVEAVDDELIGDYTALLQISDLTGDIQSIANGTFRLFVADNDVAAIFEDDFETGTLAQWTTFNPTTGNQWNTGNFAENSFAVISNFQSSVPAEGWLISPRYNFDVISSPTLEFSTLTAFNDEDGENVLEVVVLLDYEGGDPSTSQMISFSPTLDPHRGGGFGDFTNSGVLDLNEVSGRGNIAFHYTANDASDGSQWQVDNVLFRGGVAAGVDPEDPIDGDGGDGGGEEPMVGDFEDDFESQTLDNWTTFDASGSNDWDIGTFSDNYYAVVSNFNSDVPAEDWLISPEFDFDAAENPTLNFETLTAFNDGNVLEVVVLTNYDGGDPANATITVLSPDLDPHMGGGFGNFTPSGSISLDGISGLGHVAFHYTAEGADDGSQWQVDNVVVAGVGFDGGDSGGGDGGGTGDVTTIADARGSMGSTLTIRGIVTTPDYGFGNGQYFVQDATAGINIFHGGNMGIVDPGDEVEIVGEIGEFGGQVQIAPSSVTIISTNNTLPTAANVDGTDLSVTSPLQSSRVTIDNVTLNDPSEWPTSAIDAGSGVNVNVTADGVSFIIRIDRGESFFDGSAAPTGSFTLTGVLARFDEDVQIFPFVESDIQ